MPGRVGLPRHARRTLVDDSNLVTIMRRTILHTGASGLAVLLSIALYGCGGSNDNGQSAGQEAARVATATDTVDACALFSLSEIADVVGNPVLEGRVYAGPEVCQWNTEDPDHVSLLLTAYIAGSVHTNVLCEDLSALIDGGEPVIGLGDKATFKYSGVSGIFDSGDLAACGEKGFVSVSLNGRKDEAAMKEAAIALTRTVFSRL